MYHLSDRELAEGIAEHVAGTRRTLGFWFRYMCEEAEKRGLATIDRKPDENPPFWWDYSQVKLTEMGRSKLPEVERKSDG